jgi:hypothetical protein
LWASSRAEAKPQSGDPARFTPPLDPTTIPRAVCIFAGHAVAHYRDVAAIVAGRQFYNPHQGNTLDARTASWHGRCTLTGKLNTKENMKISSPLKYQALAALLALSLAGMTQIKADDHYRGDRNHYQHDDHGYYDGNHHRHDYSYYNHHRGYWDNNNGVRFFINLD